MSEGPLTTGQRIYTGCIWVGGGIVFLFFSGMTGAIGYMMAGVPGAIIGALVPIGVCVAGALLALALRIG